MSRKLITFAGPGGAGKSQVANYLSWNLGWGIFSNNAIRLELSEDLGRKVFSDPEYLDLRGRRFADLLKMDHNIILNASVDRTWPDRRPELSDHNIETFIISLDVSREFLLKLYRAKGYDEQFAEGWLTDHQNFLNEFKEDVGFSITDQNFGDRMKLSMQAVQNWVKANA